MNQSAVTYLHLRAQTPPRNPLEAMFGVTHMSPFGGMTVAMKQVGPDLHYAISRCNSGKKGKNAERYVKKEGRDRALARLEAPADDVEANKYRRVIADLTTDQFQQLCAEQGATLGQLLKAEVIREQPTLVEDDDHGTIVVNL